MKSFFKNLSRWSSKSNDRKVLIQNFCYLSLLQFAGYLFPLLTMPYLARVIGPVGFGKIAFALAVIVWIQTIVDWGFSFTATRDIAQNRNDINKVSEILSVVLVTKILISVFAFFILWAFVVYVPMLKENSNILFISYLMIPGYILFPDWFFQAIEKMQYTTIFSLIIKFIFTVLVFILIEDENDYILQPLITAIGYILCGMVSLFLIFYKWGYRFFFPSITSVFAAIKGSANIFIFNLVPNLYNSFSILLLNLYGGTAANGFFDGGNRFVTLFQNLQLVLSRTFFPFLSRRIDRHLFFAKLNFIVGVLFCALLFTFAPIIVDFMLGNDFQESVVIIRILSLSLVSLAVANTYGTNYLIIYHHDKEMRNITMISSLIGFLIAFPLINNYSCVGAALTILISRSILAVLSFIKYKQLS